MGSCTLQIAGRVVLRCASAPPEAEYALFEPGDIELRASEPGNVRELGYRTTAATARTRLESVGITPKLAEEAAQAMRPALAQVYARGAAVRRAAIYFGPTELFEGAEYDPEERQYKGAWLDLPALAADLNMLGAGSVLQVLHLVSLLYEVSQDAPVMLHTLELTRERRAGERTHRRVPLEHATGIVDAVRKLSWNVPASPPREGGPSVVELLDTMRGRVGSCADGEARERLLRIERALSTRTQPARGPLADVELWALERQMTGDDTGGVLEKLDAVERQRGRTPATTYLRARASLLLGKENPRVIAERVSALALSMSSFAELGLLAARAWVAAGDARRALPYARDLMENPGLDDELRLHAEMMVATITAGSSVGTSPMVPMAPLSAKPILNVGDAEDPSDGTPDTLEMPPVVRPPTHPTLRQPIPSAMPPSGRGASPSSMPARGHSPSISPPPFPAPPPMPTRSSMAPPPRESVVPRGPGGYSSAPSAVRDDDIEDAPPRGSIAPAPRTSTRPPSKSSKPPPQSPLVETRRRSSWPDARAEPDPTPPGDGNDGARPLEAPPTRSSAAYMRGASQPPFKADKLPSNFPPPILPRLAAGVSESAETLTLPPGMHGQAGSTDFSLPTSVVDARIQFTHLARELGREYRTERGIELRTDLGGLEAMQHHLREAFAAHKVQTAEQALDVRRHGAFLSEILARTLGAEWVDIGPSELGYWAMMVPPGVRVWPFGRVLRLIQMGHKERDLVSYYLELQSRTRGR